MSRLLEALHSGRVLLMDGAMGTELQRRGLKDGEPPELWNLTHPEEVRAVHRAYVEAGAEILVANSFQANPAALAKHGLSDRIAGIRRTALEHAHVTCEPTPIIIASIGPCECPDIRGQAGTADGILLETWSCTPEMHLDPPIQSLDLEISAPLLLSFAFRRDAGRTGPQTAQGAAAEDCAILGQSTPVRAIGTNCGVDMDMEDVLDVVRRYREVVDDLPIFIRPNAGTPTRTANGWEYPRSPEYMADKLWPLLEAGVTMVGGCCGTTPAHIAAFRRVIDEWNARK